MARGVSAIRVIDDGTVVPTAAGGSVAFAPEVAIPALMAMRARYGARLYARYGFKDAFNPSFTFVDAGSRSGTVDPVQGWVRSEEHTSELQALMRSSYAVFCLKKKKHNK